MVARVSVDAGRLPVASEALVRQYARELITHSGTAAPAQVLVLRSQLAWQGPERFEIQDNGGIEKQVQVRTCVSPLEVREAMRECEGLLIVLTDQSDSELGLGILARCYNQTVVTPSMMQAVKGSFRARRVDSVLARMNWVAEPLVTLAPTGGWPAAPGGILTRDHALSNLTGELLGLPTEELDPSGILNWTLIPAATDLFCSQHKEVQEGIIDWVRSVIGPVAGIALRSSIQSHSVDALTLGLAADALWTVDIEPDADVVAARARLEAWTGVYGLDDTTARAFAESARGALQRMEQIRNPARPAILARATSLFDDLRYPLGAERSFILPAGFQGRLRNLATQIQTFVGAGCEDLGPVEESFANLLQHELSSTDNRATQVPRMAVRLCRWLTLPAPTTATTLQVAVHRQMRELAFVDWAAADVWVGSTDPAVSSAWFALYEAVHAKRDTDDRRFAELLAGVTTSNVLPDTLVPVERVISEVLSPLAAKGNQVLIILVDGMSAAVAAELAEEAAGTGWFEAVPEKESARTATVAVLPTLTRYSRTSFFCGTLTPGGQAEERAGFAALTGGKVFHKADLVAEAGQSLSSTVMDAIDSSMQMVAVVLNTVDDTLSKADPGGTDWTLTSIQHLQPLLDRAAACNRTVVLISDHGHVVERGSEALSVAGAENRFRPVSSGPVDTQREVELSGKRVLAEGGVVIAAVDEKIRYATKQAGYHGGASAAEVTIPIIVLDRQPERLRNVGWIDAPPQAPYWWNDTVNTAITAATTSTKAARKPKPVDQVPGQVGLDIEIPTQTELSTADPSAASLVEQVLGSQIYLGQKKRIGARAVDDKIVRAVLTSLLERSGRAHRETLAAAASIPSARMNGTLTVMRRQLNIEGYEVLSTDIDEVTIMLNQSLLREQFLEDPA